jgi:hypothetical protein
MCRTAGHCPSPGTGLLGNAQTLRQETARAVSRGQLRRLILGLASTLVDTSRTFRRMVASNGLFLVVVGAE